jgi:hemerythrin-like domain-containing protein
MVLVVAVIAFSAGFVPGWLKSRSAHNRLSEMRRELAIAQIQNKLAAATLDSNRGQHEQARQSASQFFTQLRDEIDQDKNSAFTAAQRDQAKQILNQRDDIITLLARGDPGSSKKLSDMYVAFRNLLSGSAKP